MKGASVREAVIVDAVRTPVGKRAGGLSTMHATELLGGETYDKDGHFVGHVTELFVEPADQPNRVARFLLGRGKYLPLVARYDHLVRHKSRTPDDPL